MRRLLMATRAEARLELRYGVVAAAAFVTVVWVLVLRQLAPADRATALPLVLFADSAIVGLFFLPGLVLFEGEERTGSALAVTPLRFGEYLGAKVATLTVLAVGISAFLAVAAGTAPDLAVLVVGVAELSVVASLLAYVVVARCDGIVAFALAVQLPALPLALPLIPFLGWLQSPLWFAVPSHGPLVLMGAAMEPVGAATTVAAALTPLPWVPLLWRLARRAHRQQGARG